jgi:hypothetical protein
MARWLKQSTAYTLKIGPFVDETDGKTAETALTISQADVRLSKNGGDMAQKNESTSCTHDEIGVYDCPVNSTDTGTLGCLELFVHESGALPVWEKYMVLPSNVWDSLFGSDLLQVDQREVGGVALGSFITTGTVSAYTDATNIAITGLATIRKGAVIVATANTGGGGAAIVFSHNSGSGATVLEDPGFPAALDATTTYIVFAGPNVTAISLDDDDMPNVNVQKVNDVELQGTGVPSSDPWEPA